MLRHAALCACGHRDTAVCAVCACGPCAGRRVSARVAAHTPPDEASPTRRVMTAPPDEASPRRCAHAAGRGITKKTSHDRHHSVAAHSVSAHSAACLRELPLVETHTHVWARTGVYQPSAALHDTRSAYACACRARDARHEGRARPMTRGPSFLCQCRRVITNKTSHHQQDEPSPTRRVIANKTSHHQQDESLPTRRVITNKTSHHQTSHHQRDESSPTRRVIANKTSQH